MRQENVEILGRLRHATVTSGVLPRPEGSSQNLSPDKWEGIQTREFTVCQRVCHMRSSPR